MDTPGRRKIHVIARRGEPTADLHRLLSDRELQVLEAARQGLTNAEIARLLGITVHTVKFHLSSIYRKLGAANRTAASVRLLSAESSGSIADARG